MTKRDRIQALIDARLETIRLSWIDIATKPLSNTERMAERAAISQHADELLRLLTARDHLMELGQGDEEDA